MKIFPKVIIINIKIIRQVNRRIISVKIKDFIEIEYIEIGNMNFKSLNLREEHIEEI
ncbi:hypothetical protein J2S18_000583 [Eubacterium multiforme]|uniref:Uncharacterized protein n=1 Tax=Eubacterium multiforme TaxID=83339 RepID=A0ABT9UR52_9FIRM|nr:hypothetical protein [Eubacterium multiforme]